MMSFEEEYKMWVQIEAKIALESIIDNAVRHDYEKDLFLEDVIKEIRNQLKDRNK